jgi:hypothetical protein
VSFVLRVFVFGGPLPRASRQSDFGVTPVTIDASEIDLAVVHVFDALMAIVAADASASSFGGGHPPQVGSCGGWITGRGGL